MAEEKKPIVQEEDIEFEETYLTRGQLVWRAFKKHKLGVFGLWVLVIMYLMAIFADFLAPHDPYEQSLVHSYAPPTPVHYKYRDKWVGPYVLPSVSFINKFTSERDFYEMLFPSRIEKDGRVYEIEEKRALINGKEYTYSPERGEDIFFEFKIEKKIGIRRKDGVEKLFPYEIEQSRYLLMKYNSDLLEKGEIDIHMDKPTAKTSVLSNFGDTSKAISRFVSSENDIDRVWLHEKLLSIDVKKANVVSHVVNVEELETRVASGVRSWMEGVLAPVMAGIESGSVDPKNVEEAVEEIGLEMEKVMTSAFLALEEKGMLFSLVEGNEMAYNELERQLGDLKKLGFDVRKDLKSRFQALAEQGLSDRELKDAIRTVFTTYGKETVEELKKRALKLARSGDYEGLRKFIGEVEELLIGGVKKRIEVCNAELEKMVKEMRYEEKVAEGLIRGCITELVKSEMNGTRYLPGETMAIAKMFMDFGIISDPSFMAKIEDFSKLQSLSKVYKRYESILSKASKPTFRPSNEEKAKLLEALKAVQEALESIEIQTPQTLSKIKIVLRSVSGARRYLERGRFVYYYFRRINDSLRDLVGATDVLEQMVARIVSVGEIGFSYPTIGKIEIRKYGHELLAKIELNGEGVDSYDYRIYRLRFFNKSWPGKLLWLFPLSYHIVGVENPDNNPYVKYFMMGADQFGRDVWSRIVFASRISLSIGLIGMAITFGLALIFGGISGYYGGIIDEIMMRIAEIIMSIPGFYLLILLRALLPMDIPSTQIYILLVFILSFIGWAGTSRVIRGMVLSIRQREFVEAAIAIGLPDFRVLWKHVLPNTTSYLIVAATLRIPGYILGEAGLSYLGLGIREPDASWGLMLAQAQDVYVMQHAPWLLIPGAFIFFTVLAFNFVGDALRDALDPRSLG